MGINERFFFYQGITQWVWYVQELSLSFIFFTGLPVHTAWSQFDLTLAVGGYARYIRLWDAERELKKADLATGSDSYVSSLRCSNYYAASSAASGIFTAGFGDGSVKLFDIRLGSLTLFFIQGKVARGNQTRARVKNFEPIA